MAKGNQVGGRTKTRGVGLKPGRIPASVKTQADMYRHDQGSALGRLHGVNKNGKNSLSGGKS